MELRGGEGSMNQPRWRIINTCLWQNCLKFLNKGDMIPPLRKAIHPIYCPFIRDKNNTRRSSSYIVGGTATYRWTLDFFYSGINIYPTLYPGFESRPPRRKTDFIPLNQRGTPELKGHGVFFRVSGHSLHVCVEGGMYNFMCVGVYTGRLKKV